MLFIFLRLVKISETAIIFVTWSGGWRDSAFKVCRQQGKYKSLQLSLGLEAEIEAHTSRLITK